MSKWFLGFIITRKSTIPKFHHLPQHFSFPVSPIRYCTTTSQPLPVSYLINNFGFSHQSALKVFNNKQVRFKTLQKPHSVLTFFQNNGFSHSNMLIIIKKAPWLLSSKPHKTLLPKFQFFLSKGASSSDIVSLLTANPTILKISLEKRIIPLFELLSRFFKTKTNKDVIVCLIRHSTSFIMNSYSRLLFNLNLMTDFGVSNSNIAKLLQIRPSIFGSNDLIKSLEEVKGIGFRPSKAAFRTALMAKKCMSKKLWDEKVETFKKWGWSDEAVFQAFRLRPKSMLASINKVNLVMNFWVNQLGWSSLAITKNPNLFTYSLHKRIIPRAAVVQVLLMKGLQKKNASLTTPFTYTEKLFLSNFVFRFKEESDYLLKLYEEKMKLAYTEENNGMPLTK